MTSIILVELITLERFTNAYGLLLLVQGLANLLGPPVAGLKLLFLSLLSFHMHNNLIVALSSHYDEMLPGIMHFLLNFR
jgi:hypothetical protein